MTKPLMPYGSKSHVGLIVKEGSPGKLAERLSAQLANRAASGSAGYLIRGGMEVGKITSLQDTGLRLVRLTSGTS